MHDMDAWISYGTSARWGSRTAGHPEYGHAMGIETTTGPLGQGISTAVGMALAERMHNARFGDELVDHLHLCAGR